MSHIDNDHIVGLLYLFDEIKSQTQNGKKGLIVDARSRGEYNGSEVKGARRWHIPMAINIDWTRNIGNDSFNSKDKLSKIYPKKWSSQT